MRTQSGLDDILPLSPLQDGLLFHALLDTDGFDPYISQLILDLEGVPGAPLDVTAVHAACQALLDRHANLRATFRQRTSGQSVALIPRHVALPWREVDLSGAEPAAREVDLARVLDQERAQRFDPATPPLLRSTLVRLSPDRHRLVLTHHHILLDGWSVPVLVREFLALYQNGGPSTLPPVTPYRDHLGWLAARDRDSARAAWREAFAGLDEPTLVAPVDHARTPQLPRTLTRTLSAETTRRLVGHARRGGWTISTVLQAAWAVVLGRLTGRDDVVFGATVSGRPPEIPRVADMIGLFINTVPVRVRLLPGDSVRTALLRLQDEQIRLLDHQHLGLVEVRQLAGHGELFDTLTVVENWPERPDPGASHAGIRVRGLDVRDATHYPLYLVARPGERLELRLHHHPGAIDEDTADRLAVWLMRVLEEIAADPERPVHDLEVLTAAERKQLLHGWNDTTVEVPPGTLAELLAAQAARTPKATAVVAEGVELCYTELHRRADALAARLRARGVGPEAVVAVAVPRSTELMVALLGVLKSGAAYLPLDLDYPAERVAFMLTDSRARLVVSTPAAVSRLPEVADVEYVVVDGDDRAGDCSDGFDLTDMQASPDHPAYLIYTSGSTGRPKGVLVTHRAIVNRLAWMQGQYPLQADDRVLQKTPASFDVSVWEFFWALCEGAAVVLARPDGHRDPSYLAALITTQRVTTLHFVPSMLEAFLTADDVTNDPGWASSLRRAFSSGEALTGDTARRWHTVTEVPLHNLYGPTEAAVDVTHFTIEDDPTGEPTPAVPIGLPVWNTRLYVLDACLRPVPAGVPGELYLAGVQLARGYHDQPGLTAERFVAHPYGPPGERMYRTGDLGRRRADGMVEYLGRTDHQVKVRGNRIELGEIETTLAARPEVSQAAVIVRPDGPSGAILVAYLVATPATTIDTSTVQAALAAALPDPMVPSAFVVLDELPLTPSGKLDRDALPGLAPTRTAIRRPRDEREQILCQIVADVLGLSEVGIDDDFFTLGGDSIVAIQLVNRARKQDVSISPREVFLHRTPAALAAATSERPAAVTSERPAAVTTTEGPAASVSDQDGVGSVPPLPIVQRLSEWGGPIGRFNQSILLTSPTGSDLNSLGAVLQAVLDRHDGLRLRLTRHAPALWSLETTACGSVRAADLLRRVDVAGMDPDALRVVITAEADAAADRLDPDAGTMLQAVWLDPGGSSQGRLLIVAHHLVVDGVSWRILQDDLAAAWDAVSAGDPPGLDPVGTSLRSFARAFVEQAQEPSRLAELKHWIETLRPGADLVPGPVAVGTVGGACHHVLRLSASQTVPLLTSVPAAARAEVTDVLVAALRVAVSRWHERHGRDGSSDLLVDLERHGREEVVPGLDLSRTVGWFTSIAPVRLPACADVAAALKVTKERLRAVSDGGIGYGMLRYANARTTPALAGSGQPQLLFNYLGRIDAAQHGDWSRAAEADAAVPAPDPEMGVPHPLAINAVCAETAEGPQLEATFTYLASVLSEPDIRELADGWAAALRELIVRTGAGDGGALTPSDLSLVTLTQQEIDLVQQVSPAPVEDIWPLSPLQKGLYFHSAYDQSSDAYTAQFTLDLNRRLDAERMRAAAVTFMVRNPTLRAGFTSDGLREPVQFIAAHLDAPLTEIDLTPLPEQERLARAEELMAEDQGRPFDVAAPPLWRMQLIHLAEDHDRLVVNRQFMLWDGWSEALVVDQLLALYERGGEDHGLPAPRGSYHAYLAWIAEQDTAAAADVWRQALSGLAEPTLVAPAVVGFTPVAPGRCHIELSEAASEGLRAAAQRHRITLNTVFNTALALVLSSAVGRDDIVFGTTVAGRPTDVPGIEDVIGLFLNTVPVRMTLDPAESVLDLLQRVQSDRLDVMEYEYLGLGAIQQACGHSQLFDVLYVLQNFYDETTAARLNAAHGITGGTSLDHTHYPLTFVVLPGSRVSVRLEYRTDVLSEDAAERLLRRFVGLVDVLVGDVSAGVGSVPVLSSAERAEIAARWSGVAGPVGQRTVADLLGAQASATPDAVALVFGAAQLTYGELDARVNRLARLLIGRGAGPERVVALGLPRSLEMVVALFAVLRTGAAYLPLELDHPAQRLVGILSDAAPVVLVSTSTAAERLAASGVPSVLLDDPVVLGELAGLAADELSDEELGPFARNRDGRLEFPAYVIYTSGSAGRPKGVVTPYRGLTNMQFNHREEIFGPAVAAVGGRRLRIAHTVSFAFDMSWEELLWLVEGHQVHICDEELRRDAEALVAYCDAHRIDVVNVTPTYAHHLFQAGLLETAKGGHRPALVMLGGEAVSDAVWNRLRDTEGTFGYNLYGPTEYTINTLGGGTLDSPTPTVGRPIWNTHARVMDAWLRPVPDGVAGELYIAGIGLARGYLNRPELTAERFIADPYGPPCGRMYRTGDLVRRRPDGMLDFLGRTDAQVKIRGYRVELGEIETALTGHPRVAQAAVIADNSHLSGVGRLVGYVVTTPMDQADRDRVEREQVGERRQIYDTGYAQFDTALWAEDFSGWDSSYDGKPIPLEHMREWRETTVDRIRELRPRRVLEIGVGSGLLLSRLAPDCDSYWGTDFSRPAIDQLRVDLNRGPTSTWRVELACQPAHVVDGLPVGFFDTVVINSVIQYFPSISYLTDVLHKAMSLVAPGGAIFIGDVRNQRLVRCFHTAVQLARIDGTADAVQVHRVVDRGVGLERELLVDPDYFAHLHEHVPELGGVDIRIKRGWSHNELTRYRYDVIAHKAPVEVVSLADAPQLTWGTQVPDVDALTELLAQQRPARLRACRVPNPRVADEAAASRALENGGSITDVLFRLHADSGIEPQVVEPETLHELGQRLGYRVATTWSDAIDGSYDAVFLVADQTRAKALTGVYSPPASGRSLAACANDPTAARHVDALVPQLREHLQQRLPDYMVPATLMVLNRLPLTVNGKLDVKALPVPDLSPTTPSRAPQSPWEEVLCELFAEVLGLDRVGVDDDFFTLGGDSIISIQLTSRARKAGVRISPRDVFERRSVAALATVAKDTGDVATAATEEPDSGIGEVALTPVMRWLLERGGPIDGYAMAVVVQTPAGLGQERLTHLWQAVLDRHDLLRARLEHPDGEGQEWTLRVTPVGSMAAESCISRVDAAGLDGDELRRVVETEEVAAVGRLALQAGVTAQLVWFDCGPARPGRLLVMIHHLVIDGVSWRILMEDLALGWTQLAADQAPMLEPPRTSFRQWAQLWVAKAQDPARVAELAVWTKVLDGADALLSERPLDWARDTWSTSAEMVLVLPTPTEPLLTSVPAVFHAGVDDVLLTALALAVAQWRRRRGHDKQRRVLVDLEGHGRQEQLIAGVDLSRTVGWFTSIFPVRLDVGGIDLDEALAGGRAVGQALKRIKEQLRVAPDHGLGFGLLRYLHPETATVLAGLPAAQIMFNYLGRFTVSDTADWAMVPNCGRGGGAARGLPMSHTLHVNAWTADQPSGLQLHASWTWPTGLLTEEAVRELAQGWFQALDALAAHAATPQAGGHTPSDMALVSASQEDIDELEAEWVT